MNWTPEQQQAIEARGNLIVSAAAGAGKTAVLTERVVRLVEEGGSMDRMLILTFTKAAAGEMKSRIEKRLFEAAANAEGEQKKRLRRQSLLCRSAQISTIHAFCARVISRHFHMVDLPPNVGTLDETESAVLKQQSAAEGLLAFAKEEEDSYKILLRALDKEPKMGETLLRFYDFLCAQPDREQWLLQAEEALYSGSALENARNLCLEEGQRQLTLAVAGLKNILPTIPPDAPKAIGVLQADIESMEWVLSQSTPADFLKAMEGVTFGRISFPKTFEPEDKEEIKALREDLKKCFKHLLELLTRDTGEEEACHKQSAAAVTALFHLEQRFESIYQKKKLDRDRVDFNDLEHYCAKILSDDRVAAEYRERFDHIIVDEYQDSNRVQEAILQRICRGNNLFFVGDVKQSIYGFRNAEPSLFLEKLWDFHGEKGQRIDLNCNFRSSSEVLEQVNRVFSQLMAPGMGDIVYDHAAALKSGAPQPVGSVEIHLLEKADPLDGGAMENPEAESRLCASLIQKLMSEEQYEESGGEKRPYAYRDFAILLRGNAAAARTYARTLSLQGIPCYAQLTGGYFESIEVTVFLNLLRLLDNRRQDIPLISILRSQIGSFSDEELIHLRTACSKGDLLDCLLLSASASSEGKAAKFLNKLESWRQQSLLMPVEELVSWLLDETGFYREMGAMPGGKQRQGNLTALVEKARAYDGTGAFGLSGFLRYMDMAKNSAREGAAPQITTDAVRILTVHKSKGLEFPVVFLCDTARRFNRKDEQESLLLDGELGVSLSFVDGSRTRRIPPVYKAIKLKKRQQQVEEEMRVLYVAMTRPKRRLYLVGIRKDAEKLKDRLPMTTPLGLYTADSPLRWLLLTLNGYAPIMLHSTEDFAPPEKQVNRQELPPADPLLIQALQGRYGWEYPYAQEVGIPHKTSVTGLNQIHDRELVFDPPLFMQEEGEETALQHGTHLHAILQHIPLHPKGREWEDAMDALPPWDKATLRWFLSSPLFGRMQKSPDCRRELPFTLSVPARELEALQVPDSQELVLLQGVMDVCFRTPTGWVLLDYKTDRLHGADPKEAAEGHRPQVELYARVLTRLTGLPVEEKYVVYLSEKEVVSL